MPDTKKSVLCPECDKDVELVNGEGTCGNCGLDVGWVYEKRRRDKALDKVKEREEQEQQPPKRKNKFNFGD